MAKLPPRVYGLETEYAIAQARKPRDGDEWSTWDLIRLLASRAHSMDELGSVVWLANGGCFSSEIGGHLEYSTPECWSPRQALLYLKAGDHMVCDLMEAGPRSGLAFEARTHGFDYVSGESWGALHESYGHYGDFSILPQELVPHLVTRQVYCGAGGYSGSAAPRFLISPRAQTVRRTVSADSTEMRGLFHTKDEPLAAVPGYHRVHVLCGDRPRSETSLLLQIGTTALVLMAIEAGARPSETLRIKSPVAATKAVSEDIGLAKPIKLANGASMTALEVQCHLHAIVSEHVAAMPDWATEILDLWEWALTTLWSDPEAAASFTDWGVKLLMMRQLVAEQGIPSPTMAGAARGIRTIEEAIARQVKPTGGYFRAGAPSELARVMVEVGIITEKARISWGDLQEVIALRTDLCLQDLELSRLGGGCTMDELDAVEPRRRVADLGDVAHAADHPPQGGRAQVRGEFVRTHAGRDNCGVEWGYVWDGTTRRRGQTRNPFTTEIQWETLPEPDLDDL